jgi:hypothetical protein
MANICRVRHHGGVDGRPNMGYAELCLEDGAAIDGGDGF